MRSPPTQSGACLLRITWLCGTQPGTQGSCHPFHLAVPPLPPRTDVRREPRQGAGAPHRSGFRAQVLEVPCESLANSPALKGTVTAGATKGQQAIQARPELHGTSWEPARDSASGRSRPAPLRCDPSRPHSSQNSQSPGSLSPSLSEFCLFKSRPRGPRGAVGWAGACPPAPRITERSTPGVQKSKGQPR